MVLSSEDKILIKALRQKKGYWTTKGLGLAWVTHTENRGHRFSGEEAGLRGDEYRRKHWIIEELVLTSPPRKSAGTDRSVHEIARETDQDNRSHLCSVFRHNIGKCDFQRLNSVSFKSFLTKLCTVIDLTIQHYLLQILFKSVETQ